MSHLLSEGVKITPAITPTEGAAGTDDTVEGAILDMAGFEGVLIKVTMGAITAGAVTAIKAQQGAAADLSDEADLEGSGQAVADDDDDKVFYIDLFRPEKRYVRLAVTRATQNAVIASAEYFQYGARNYPVSHGANVAGEMHRSPDEGAA